MDGDVNDIFQKLNNILEDKDMSNNLKNILNSFSSSSESNSSSESSNNSNESNSSEHQRTTEFDINTILKIKTIMDSLNSNVDDPRSNLLLSLKPYLGSNKKEKIDQYIKFLHIAKVLELMNPLGGDSKKNE